MESTFGSTGFVNPAFNDQHGGSRITPYTATVEVDELICNQSVGKFQSISAIPIYRNKSHEELRWEDYQLGDKGICFTRNYITCTHIIVLFLLKDEFTDLIL